MITGTHVLLYRRDPEADRAFFRDVLTLRTVDARHHAGARIQTGALREDRRGGVGLATTVRLPSGPSIGLYQPTHPLAIEPVAPAARA